MLEFLLLAFFGATLVLVLATICCFHFGEDEFTLSPQELRISNDVFSILVNFLLGLLTDLRHFVSGFSRVDFISQCSTLDLSQPTKGLILFVHGLKTGGKISNQIQYLEPPVREKFPGYTLFAPQVLNGGNCPLNKATKPILAFVRSYMETNPNKPIVLIGVSNGARIVFNIMNQIDLDSQDTLVITIAGALYGSPLAKLALNYSCITNLDKRFLQEMIYGSRTAQKLIKTAQLRRNDRLTNVCFGTTTDDNLISSRSSFPRLAGVRTHVFRGESHRSVFRASIPDVIGIMSNWFQFHAPR